MRQLLLRKCISRFLKNILWQYNWMSVTTTQENECQQRSHDANNLLGITMRRRHGKTWVLTSVLMFFLSWQAYVVFLCHSFDLRTLIYSLPFTLFPSECWHHHFIIINPSDEWNPGHVFDAKGDWVCSLFRFVLHDQRLMMEKQMSEFCLRIKVVINWFPWSSFNCITHSHRRSIVLVWFKSILHLNQTKWKCPSNERWRKVEKWWWDDRKDSTDMSLETLQFNLQSVNRFNYISCTTCDRIESVFLFETKGWWKALFFMRELIYIHEIAKRLREIKSKFDCFFDHSIRESFFYNYTSRITEEWHTIYKIIIMI